MTLNEKEVEKTPALPGRFVSPDYEMLLVAEKGQTEFDQWLQRVMYVNKSPSSVHTVGWCLASQPQRLWCNGR